MFVYESRYERLFDEEKKLAGTLVCQLAAIEGDCLCSY